MANGVQQPLPRSELPQTRTSTRTKRLVRCGCLIIVLIIAAFIGVPTYWYIASYAPVTLFKVHGTSIVEVGECGQWQTTLWPFSSSLSSRVQAVDAISDNDIWVGTHTGDILRGDGQSWSRVQTLKAKGGEDVNVLQIDMGGDKDVWVLGSYKQRTSQAVLRDSVLFHWDGMSFKQIEVPGLDNSVVRVYSLAVVDDGSAWFVGSNGRIWRWTGTDIEAVEHANTDIRNYDLRDVAAISADDIWAVGSRAGYGYGAAVIHWDGKEWKIAKEWTDTDSGAATEDTLLYLLNVVAISKNDIWAMGDVRATPGSHVVQNQAVHWNGQEWEMSKMPSFEAYDAVRLSDMSASASNDVWAVGHEWTNRPSPLAIHWDGVKWSIVDAPSPLKFSAFNVAKAFPGKLWVAGVAYQDDDFEPAPIYSMSAEFKLAPCR